MKILYVVALVANAALLEIELSATWDVVARFGWNKLLLLNLVGILSIVLALIVILHALLRGRSPRGLRAGRQEVGR